MIRSVAEDAKFIIGAQRRPYALALVWTAGIAVSLTLLNPLTTRWIFDVAVPERRFELLLGVAVGATLIFSGIRWLDYQAQLYQQRLTNRMTSQLTRRLMEAYYRLPANTVAARDQGYFVARTMTEVQDTAGPMVGIGVGLLRGVATLVTAIGTILLLSWQLTLVLLVVTPLLLTLSRYFARQLNVNAREVQERNAEQQAVHTHAIGAYRTVRTFDLKDRALAHLMGSVTARLEAVYTLSRTTGLYGTLSRMSLGLTEFMVLTAGGYAVMTTSLTIGGLMAYMGAYWLAVNAVQSLIGLLPQLSVLHAHTDRLREIVATPSPSCSVSDPAGQILSWRDVSCGLGTEPTLQNVNVDVPFGTRVLVQGANGAGKSTLMLTALGHLTPTHGEIERPAAVSGLIEPFVFPALPLTDLVADYDQVRFRELVTELDMAEVVHQRFTELSLGQRKKFALIMTVLRPADLYIFDEPLANLDDRMQDTVLRLMLAHTSGKTVVVVMHSALQYSEQFDVLLSVKDGQVRLSDLPHSPLHSTLAPASFARSSSQP